MDYPFFYDFFVSYKGKNVVFNIRDNDKYYKNYPHIPKFTEKVKQQYILENYSLITISPIEILSHEGINLEVVLSKLNDLN